MSWAQAGTAAMTLSRIAIENASGIVVVVVVVQLPISVSPSS
jgi:hypothetical protein